MIAQNVLLTTDAVSALIKWSNHDTTRENHRKRRPGALELVWGIRMEKSVHWHIRSNEEDLQEIQQ